jgi:midasin (ATPase involved in ribosome maturation)
LLTKIRQSIEKTKDPKDKHYLRFLERYIHILDRMCKENSKKLLYNYLENLKRALYLEKNSKYSFLISLTIKSLKLGLIIVNPFKPEKLKDINNQICNLQNKIIKFKLKNKDSGFINTYCKILIKLPRLTFIRRGLFLDSISMTSI